MTHRGGLARLTVTLGLVTSVGLAVAAGPRPAIAIGTGAAAGPGHPNVLLVMTDDQGLADFSAAGHGALETPHLDRLRAESPRVDRFYVSAVCSPTRASLMTGRSNQRTRVVDTWIGRSMMEPDEVTVAESLRAAGYATGIFGKWHLGDCYPMRPQDQGFERTLVHRGGGLAQPSEPPENRRRYTDPVLFSDGVQVETEGYCTDVYVDAALEFIDASLDAGRPFFAYVAPNAPHDPYHDVPAELHEKYAARDLSAVLEGHSDRLDREARICAMVENIDGNVGRLLDHLAARGVEGDTLVIYLHDNGPVWGRPTGGLRGAKSSPYEGGLRSPLFVRWPGVLDPATRVEVVTAHVDLLPTILEFAGVEHPAGVRLDGRSLAPVLRGEDPDWPPRELFLQAHRGDAPAPEHSFAVLGERWKLVRASGFGRREAEPDHPFELYDLVADPGEEHDLADEHPEEVARLRAAYARWFEDVSSTRADNYAPPRIVVGSPAEPVTVLTKQDARTSGGDGWGAATTWLLEAREAVDLEATLLFREPVTVDRAVVTVDGRAEERAVSATGDRVALGAVRCPAGRLSLEVRLFEGEEERPVHQVVLGGP